MEYRMQKENDVLEKTLALAEEACLNSGGIRRCR